MVWDGAYRLEIVTPAVRLSTISERSRDVAFGGRPQLITYLRRVISLICIKKYKVSTTNS